MTPLLAPWFTLNPLEWLGDAASEAVGEAWTSAMVASWSSGLWVLNTAGDTITLFISDGSQFTTGAAENPTLTIVALALRQADYISDQMGQNAI